MNDCLPSICMLEVTIRAAMSNCDIYRYPKNKNEYSQHKVTRNEYKVFVKLRGLLFFHFSHPIFRIVIGRIT